MEILGWLLIPLAATVLGLLWLTWRGRERKPVDAEQGMEDLARFRQAMEKPLPPLRDPSATTDQPAGRHSVADDDGRDS
jgi:hypothetical protein